jgi:DNA-binding XRE family transcriptional regulator
MITARQIRHHYYARGAERVRVARNGAVSLYTAAGGWVPAGYREDVDPKPAIDLHAVGSALYGREWRTQMAEALEVDRRTIHRWAKGTPLPPAVASKLRQLLYDRVLLASQLADAIRLMRWPSRPAAPSSRGHPR